MTNGSLYILSAPSGCGKTSLIKSLVKECPQLAVSISHTTRTPRLREVPGVHYHFVSMVDFQQMIKNNEFLEYAKVFDHYYGTSRAWLSQMLEKGTDVILEIDWQGMHQIKSFYPKAISIFILPPSLSSLKKRLLNRNEDTQKVVKARLSKAKNEIAYAKKYDYLVVNHHFETAVSDLIAIFKANRLRTFAQPSIVQPLLHEEIIQ